MDKDLVPNMMKANSGGLLGAVEGVSCHGFSYVLAVRFPVISQRDDAFGEALGNQAAVAFLGDLKDNLAHAVQITALGLQWQGRKNWRQFREGGSAREESREHRPQDVTGVLHLHDSFWNGLQVAGDQPLIC